MTDLGTIVLNLATRHGNTMLAASWRRYQTFWDGSGQTCFGIFKMLLVFEPKQPSKHVKRWRWCFQMSDFYTFYTLHINNKNNTFIQKSIQNYINCVHLILTNTISLSLPNGCQSREQRWTISNAIIYVLANKGTYTWIATCLASYIFLYA